MDKALGDVHTKPGGDVVHWPVECLLFREPKSTYGLAEVPTSKPRIVEMLILASILTLVVSHMLLVLLREVTAEDTNDALFPTER